MVPTDGSAMSTAPVVTDNSQQPQITADDPRVAQVLALIKARAAQAQSNPLDTAATPSTATIPQAPTPPLPTQLGGPSLAQQAAPNVGSPPPSPNLSAMAYQAPQIAQPPSANVAPTPPPSQPGPIKSFLQSLVGGLGTAAYAGTQGALQRLGLPTDYEKQQTAAKLALQQQAANDTSAYRQSLTDLTQGKSAQLDAQNAPYTFGTGTDIPAQLRGQTFPTIVATALQKALGVQQLKGNTAEDIASDKNATTLAGKQIQYGPDSYLRHGFKSLSGRDVEYDKGTGAVIKDYGPSNSIVSGVTVAGARAAANARYRTFDTVDGNGNPVTISGLDALQGGAAHIPYAQAKGIKSDQVGIQQYDQILGRISQNLPVLNDNAQRVAIAHTLAEADKNPGMAQSIFTSALQSNALTPQGAQLAADIMQGREFGGVARKYGGNMNGTEGLMNRIMANQASPLNSLQLNNDLVANDRSFTQKANKVISGISSHNAGNAGGPANIAPAATPGAHPFFSQFGGSADKQ